MKDSIIKVLKYPIIIIGLITATSLIFVFTQYLKDTFFLGPAPDLADKSILFEANGEGVQLFWRHYKENNEYTDEYLFDKPIAGDLADVLLRDNGDLWFIVYKETKSGYSSTYVYKYHDNSVKEMAFYEEGGWKNLLRISTNTSEIELVERDRSIQRPIL